MMYEVVISHLRHKRGPIVTDLEYAKQIVDAKVNNDREIWQLADDDNMTRMVKVYPEEE